MLIKCETKSNRVKGLSFHPKLSWILASLHNGVIQLWDYRIGSLIDRYEDHEGPVRGVDFHSSQPLFVSGGDDYRVKVWNYRQRRCIFTLLGHLDYIRTVTFHPKYPWILSASDDQTVRIWNWQSRNCLSVLTGHGHYVMCAQFHPKADLVVSASLDNMIRVWDVAGLREKTVSISGSNGPVTIHPPHQSDMFSTTDAVCKFILEGHDRGVNWATFHPTLPLIASGADDRVLKLWRYNESKAWEVDTLRGHFNNVSCVLFHPTRELLLSNSEDRTIRVWDINKRVACHTFRRENDRFWILTSQPQSNLIAVGHDSGMVVFKLDRERPPHDCQGSQLYVVKDKWVTAQDLAIDSATSLAATRRPVNPMTIGPRFLLFNHLNPSEINILLFYREAENTPASYELLTCSSAKQAAAAPGSVVSRNGNAQSVAFVARNRFAALEAGGALAIYNLNNELSKRLEPPVPTDRIFAATSNRILLKSEDKVVLYDLTSRKSLGEITCSGGVRYVVWSGDGQLVALLSKHAVMLATNKLEYLYSLHENIRIKSGRWDDSGAFVYSTLSHVKYCLPSGDFGIIHSLPNPIYIFRVHKQKIYYLDRNHNLHCDPLNSTEYQFKLALQRKNFDQVALFIRNGRLCGNAVIGYLRKAGYPQVAMQFVSDPATRFNLSLEYGHIGEALSAAQILDDKATWRRLGSEALRQGSFPVVEMVYQKVKDFDKLSFLYLITGNLTKLRKMLKIAEMRRDVISRFNNALYIGDVESRVRLLAEVGQLPLAALTAKAHGLTELSQLLHESLEGLSLDNMLPSNPKLFLPPVPIFRPTTAEETAWPNDLGACRDTFATAMEAANQMSTEAIADSINQVAESSPEVLFGSPEEMDLGDAVGDLSDSLGGDGVWGDLDDTLLDAVQPSSSSKGKLRDENSMDADLLDGVTISSNTFISRGQPPAARWLRGSAMVADYIAAGQFDEALSMLQKRIGLINAAPLQPHFDAISQSAYAYLPGLPQTAPLTMPLLDVGCLKDETVTPSRLYSISFLLDHLRDAHRFVTTGKFEEALHSYQSLLQMIPLAVANKAEEEAQLHEFIEMCRQYVLAMRIECERIRISEENAARNIELAVYFTTCKVQPSHLFLMLRRAIAISFKAGNFVTTATLARRLIEGKFPNVKTAQEELMKAKKVLMICEQRGSDAHVIDYDAAEGDTLTLCCVGLTRLPPGSPVVRCPLCNSTASDVHRDQLCPICNLCQLGARVLGLHFRPIA